MTRRMVNSLITLTLIVAVSFVAYDYFDKSSKQNAFEQTIAKEEIKDSDGNVIKYGARKGDKVYDYELTNIKTDETHKISDFHGKKVYLLFWASWCPYCTEEAPILQELSEERDDVVFIGVNVTSAEKSKNGPLNFIEKLDLTYINVKAQKEMFDTFHIGSFPTSIFVNSEGIIEETSVGFLTKEIIEFKLDSMK